MFKQIKYLLVLMILLAAVSTAANTHSGSAPSGSQAVENLAIVLVVDTSGSMSYTDPGRLRETAANLFIDLLSPEDYLSVITFDHHVNLIIPLQALGGISNKERIKEIIAPRLKPGGYTDYTAALQAAYEQLDTIGDEKLRPVVIFLTDGEPNPDDRYRSDPVFMNAYMDSMWETVNRFTTGSIPVYSIAFSGEVDPLVIERISMLTRGGHHILSTPLDLLVSFYELLETLKNRHRVIDETVTLDGTPQGFRFPVEYQVIQSNLIVENQEGQDFSLSLNPPQGAGIIAGNPSISRGPGYALVVFHEPGEELQGEWELILSGHGTHRILGNSDKPLKAWVVEPAYGAMHPLGEPIIFKVQLTGVETDSDLPLELFMQVTRPDQARPEPVDLTGAGGAYTGSYDLTDRPGIYEISVTVLLDGEPLTQASSQVHVKYLPLPTAEVHLKKFYRSGEILELDASLFLGGHRLTGGGELNIDYFNFILSYSDGTRVTVSLYEGGYPEQVQVQPPGGYWSNQLTFQREGAAEAILLAVGRYRGEEFLLEKTLGAITIYNPGIVALEFDQDMLYTAPGRTLMIPVTVENRSQFEESLKIDLPGNDSFSLLQSEVLLKPGEIKTLNLDIAVNPSARTGPAALRFLVEPGHPLTVVEPSSASRTVEVLTPSGYLQQRLTAPGALWTVLKGILLCGLLFLGGGSLLYRFLAYPREKLGKLLYWKNNSAAEPSATARILMLSKSGRNPVVVSFNSTAKCNFVIPGSEYNYDLVFEVKKPGRLPNYLKGWQMLLQKNLGYVKVMTATPPGVIEVEDQVFTCKELLHGVEFQSGGFSFRYLEPFNKAWARNNRGVNILEGKM